MRALTILLLCSSEPAAAAPARPTFAAKSCVTVAAASGTRFVPQGSGALIEYQGAPAVLTCRHLFDGTRAGRFFVRINGQQSWRAVSVKLITTKPTDLALLAFSKPTTFAALKANPLRVAINAPGLKQPVYCIGAFGNANSDPPFATLVGRVEKLRTAANRFDHRCWTHWGHSGSPLLNRAGDICGVHVEYDSRTYMRTAMNLESIKKLLGLRLVQRPVIRRERQNPYQFTVFVDGPTKQLSAIESVVFHLHKGSFSPADRPAKTINKRPGYSWQGWGTFLLKATVKRRNSKPQTLSLHLRLR